MREIQNPWQCERPVGLSTGRENHNTAIIRTRSSFCLFFKAPVQLYGTTFLFALLLSVPPVVSPDAEDSHGDATAAAESTIDILYSSSHRRSSTEQPRKTLVFSVDSRNPVASEMNKPPQYPVMHYVAYAAALNKLYCRRPENDCGARARARA